MGLGVTGGRVGRGLSGGGGRSGRGLGWEKIGWIFCLRKIEFLKPKFLKTKPN